jgi:hydrogenase maturation protease
MARRSSKKPILIVTCGNPDAEDDGFGHTVAEGLRADPAPGVTVVELGTRSADLLDYAEGYAAILIVDAVCCPGEKPGSLVDVDWFDPARPVLKSEEVLSTHGISLGRQIDLGQSLGMLPPSVRLVGVNIAQAEIGCLMTEAVRRRTPEAVRVIRQHAARVMRSLRSGRPFSPGPAG